ncbi:MAG: isoprenyl transferase [Eggerthellaceae bacterium]|nr:isoprenyl transferase [Eggerthellaceae bacterium]
MLPALDEIFPKSPNRLDYKFLELLPKHVAVIMDGNGRWAKENGVPRLKGHTEGVKSFREIVHVSGDIGIPYLTFYAFSTENWKRSKEEVEGIMLLATKTVEKELAELHGNNVKFRMLGDKDRLPKAAREVFIEAEETTKNNTGLQLQVAVNYGSRDEILMAVKEYASKCSDGPDFSNDEPNEKSFSKLLYTKDIPDPDLLIRTSGEFRISNFLLWQIAYSEIYVTPTLWPDFDRYEYLKALLDFQSRDRRYGGR